MITSQEHFVAFIDILGFADFVKNETSKNVFDYLSTLTSVPNELNLPILDYNIQIFSDSVVVSVPVKNNFSEWREFLLYINALQLTSITESNLSKLPLRGAIAKGEFFTDNKDLTFGKAFIRAHELESRLAFYPRIVVDPIAKSNELQPEDSRKTTEEMNNLLAQNGWDKKIAGGLKDFDEHSHLVRRDSDGLLHCNYLTSLRFVDGSWANNAGARIEKHKQFIIDNLEKAPNERISAKYNWMKTYHNWFCAGYPETHTFKIKD